MSVSLPYVDFVVICWPTGVSCVVFMNFSFLPMSCPGIKMSINIEVCSRLRTGILDVRERVSPEAEVCYLAAWLYNAVTSCEHCPM